MQTDIQGQVKCAIKRHRLFAEGERVVVGVSGGADSVCLLYLLKNLRKELKLKLYIAHLDHMLRKESAQDAEFVKRLGRRLKLPVTVGKIDIKRVAQNASLEEAARNARLAFLTKTAGRLKAEKIALAHHFDDQAETVLMRILRGTGLCGLSGILPKRKAKKVYIVRPLLSVRRREIEDYLKIRRIGFRRDSSNADEAYFRNKIRHKLLPYLEKGYNKNIAEVLFNLAQNAASDYDYLQARAGRLFKNNRTKLNLKKLSALHPSMMRLKLRGAIASLKGDTRKITFKHMRELEDLIFNRRPGAVVDLPWGISAAKQRKILAFYLR